MLKFKAVAVKIARKTLVILGCFFLILLVLAFTRIPFDVHRWLGSENSEFDFEPTAIVMLGGSGMPSESNLIRLFYVKELALNFPQARIFILHPQDSSVVAEMRNFICDFGIDSLRIFAGAHGTNTRQQAMELKEKYPAVLNENVVLVTSPENMYRSVKTFRKIEFKNVGGMSAFENALFIDLGYDHRGVGGKGYVPDVSGNLGLRYNFWNYLKLEITCLREFVAILYYKINGWV